MSRALFYVVCVILFHSHTHDEGSGNYGGVISHQTRWGVGVVGVWGAAEGRVW